MCVYVHTHTHTCVECTDWIRVCQARQGNKQQKQRFRAALEPLSVLQNIEKMPFCMLKTTDMCLCVCVHRKCTSTMCQSLHTWLPVSPAEYCMSRESKAWQTVKPLTTEKSKGQRSLQQDVSLSAVLPLCDNDLQSMQLLKTETFQNWWKPDRTWGCSLKFNNKITRTGTKHK